MVHPETGLLKINITEQLIKFRIWCGCINCQSRVHVKERSIATLLSSLWLNERNERCATARPERVRSARNSAGSVGAYLCWVLEHV